MTKIDIAPNTLSATGPITLNQASQTALDWWDEHTMLDNLDSAQVLSDLDRVRAAAEILGAGTIQAMQGNAAGIIAEVTGVGSLARFSDFATSEDLHRVRNAMAAMLFAVEIRHGAKPDPHGCVASLPAVAPRHGSKRRPLRDDEIILARSDATYAITRGTGSRLSAMQYALTESGARPMETTSVAPIDFDDPRDPNLVDLPGVNGRTRSRTVHLGAWAANVLRQGIDLHLGLNERAEAIPICWTGRSGKGSASASSGNNVKHLMERVGIKAPSLEGTAPTRWRIKRELLTHGASSALQLLGQYDPEDIKIYRVYNFLDEARPSTVHTPMTASTRSFKGL